MELRHEYRYIDDDTIEFIIESPKHGEFKVLIDAEDKEKILQHKWHLARIDVKRNKSGCRWHGFHVCRSIDHPDGGEYKNGNKRRSRILLHRYIANLHGATGRNITHIDGNGMNNIKSNLSGIYQYNHKEQYFTIRSQTYGDFKVYLDPEDWEQVSKYTWTIIKQSHTSYVKTAPIGNEECRKSTVLKLHNLIMKTPNDMLIDHINGDGLDNRRSNLRLCNYHQNTTSRKPQKNSSSRYKGVYTRLVPLRSNGKLVKKKNKTPYEASLSNKGVSYHLGRYAIEEDAAKAHDKKALELWGEFAYLNFPERLEKYLAEIQKEGEKNEEERR